MFEETFLRRTRQAWKLWLAIALIVAGGAMSLLVADRFGVFLAGLGVGVLGLLWLFAGIRCPYCRANLGWIAANKGHGTQAGASLIFMKQCPVCGADGRDPIQANGECS